jgi:hypothetical protein
VDKLSDEIVLPQRLRDEIVDILADALVMAWYRRHGGAEKDLDPQE